MDYALICAVALFAAGLTFFSGFGLGTLLLPAFAIFFPAEVAVGATAVVHLANNLFKLALVGRHAAWRVVLLFGAPAAAAAFVGAWLLSRMAGLPALGEWSIGSWTATVRPVGLVIGALIIVFALFDLSPRLRRVEIPRRWTPLGGALSGFFGGLSGHQGALRSAFLIKAGLGRDGFIATGVACSVGVDLVRLSVYGAAMQGALRAGEGDGSLALIGAGTAAAFLGSFIGSRLVRKTTIDALQTIVGAGLVLLGAAMATGVV